MPSSGPPHQYAVWAISGGFSRAELCTLFASIASRHDLRAPVEKGDRHQVALHDDIEPRAERAHMAIAHAHGEWAHGIVTDLEQRLAFLERHVAVGSAVANPDTTVRVDLDARAVRQVHDAAVATGRFMPVSAATGHQEQDRRYRHRDRCRVQSSLMGEYRFTEYFTTHVLRERPWAGVACNARSLT